jgi:glycosyltransferase involved in cell wall biosynthesis
VHPLRVLFVCHDPPAPPDNGGAIDIFGMLKSLHRLGHDVDLLYTRRGPDDPCDREAMAPFCRVQIEVMRNLGVRPAASFRPYQVASRSRLMTMPLPGEYDVAIVSDHCAGILLNPALTARRIVLRRNNSEPLYAARMAADTPNVLLKAFFLKEAALFEAWHRATDRRADQIWYVSTDELEAEARRPRPATSRVDRRLVPSALTMPPGAIEPALPAARVLYFGSLTVPINRRSVDWYVSRVLPLVRREHPGHACVIAGRVSVGEADWAARHAAGDGYQFLPNPADAEAVYRPGGIFIDPLAHDAGIKLKIIEAVRRGFPVVCSPASIKGCGLEPGRHALVAEEPAEFAAHVSRLLSDPDEAAALARRAGERLRDHFDIDRDVGAALGLLASVVEATTVS